MGTGTSPHATPPPVLSLGCNRDPCICFVYSLVLDGSVFVCAGLLTRVHLKARPYSAVLTLFSDRIQSVYVRYVSWKKCAAYTLPRHVVPAQLLPCTLLDHHIACFSCARYHVPCSPRRGGVRKSPSSKRGQGSPAQRTRFGPGTAHVVLEA